MPTLNMRIDGDLKARSVASLDALGVTTSEAVHLVLEYVARNNRLPVQGKRDKNAVYDTARERMFTTDK